VCEAPVRGLPGDFATAVQSQRAAFEDPLDDIIVKGVRQDGRETQLDLQIKNKLTFTENDAEWVDVLKRAWDTFSKGTFDPALRRIGVGIGTYNARVDQRQLITQKGHELSPDDRKSIIMISDIMIDNGVRGAGFLHQELPRAEKIER
jgi:hypothetical protein